MSSGMPVDFGYWTMKDGKRALLTYWRDSGGLVLDGPGGAHVVAVVHTEDEVRRRLEGWEDHCDQPGAIAWLTTALDGAR